MKKWILLFLSASFFVGCATSKFQLKENWIDDSDLQFALVHPALNEWYPRMGDPVIIEYHGDSVYFVYNYRPPLFATVKNGVEYKPTNNDKVNNVWGSRNEILAMVIVDNKLVGIVNKPEYKTVLDSRVAEQKHSVPVWAWILGGITATLVLMMII